MSSSTVRLYEALKTEYPNKVYLGQFDQSANLRSTDSVVMLEMINQTSSINKDISKRDQITYKVHVVGILQKEVDQKANEIRDLIEPYNDEYIYLMKFDGIETIYEDNAETFRKVVNFTCYPNQSGTNVPTGYWEHLVRFFENSGTPQYEVLNQNELNYLPMVWGYGSYPGYYIWSVNDNTFLQNDVEFYQQLPNDDSLVNDTSVVCSVDARINVAKQGFGNTFDNCIILIRIRKSAIGSIGGI